MMKSGSRYRAVRNTFKHQFRLIAWIRYSARASFLFLWLILVGALDAQAQCVIATRQDGVQLRFDVEVAKTPAARSRGLMYRKQLDARHGMWFDFGVDGAVVMWMKNTFIPLDLLFVDSRQFIVAIERGVPESERRIGAPVPVRYVLEIPAGESEVLSIQVGDQLRLGLSC